MPPAAPVSVPTLLEGDSLTSDEFLRRWEDIADLKHAELIDGIVYMPSPVSHAQDDVSFFSPVGWTPTQHRLPDASRSSTGPG